MTKQHLPTPLRLQNHQYVTGGRLTPRKEIQTKLANPTLATRHRAYILDQVFHLLQPTAITDTDLSSQLYLSVCLCICVSVYSAFTAYISLIMDQVLIKLGENVITSVRLIVLKFEHSAAKGNTTHKG